MNNTGKPCVVVAARPGLWRNALLAYLRTLPGLEIDLPADDLSTAEQRLGQQDTQFLLLDAGMCPADFGAALIAIKRQHPRLNCIALVDTADQGIQAKKSGAEHTVFKAYIDDQITSALFTLHR